MNTDFWSRIMLAALVIIGVWTAFQRGMVFAKGGDWLYQASQLIYKPAVGCPPCMASVWGTAVWFYTGGEWAMWPWFVLALAGVMKLVTIEWLSR